MEFSTTKIKKTKKNNWVFGVLPENGIFLTGIENSDPVVHGNTRRDQLKEAHNFYENFEQRLEKIASLGITWIRFGPRYSGAHMGKGEFDFDFTDKVMQKCEELGLVVVADLLHFGLPEWLHGENRDNIFFQNSQFPYLFREYARAFAERYPQVQYFTPVNEPFITATFSTKYGMWNEQLATSWNDDTSFVRAVSNISKAVIFAKQEIEAVWKEQGRRGHPVFVQNDSFEKAFAYHPERAAEVKRFNLRRFAALDLLLGKKDQAMKTYLLSQGMREDDYNWFMANGSKKNTILGIDHYPSCIHTYTEDRVEDSHPSAPYQLYNLAAEYYRRYRMPFVHLEVNGWPDYATSICLLTYDALVRLKKEGYPVVGMSWFGDEYQVGWQSGLVGPKGFEETPVGLFYKGELQPVGELFKQLLMAGL